MNKDIWILEDKGLIDFYHQNKRMVDWVIEHNETSAPYHDTNHLIGVGYLAWLLSDKDKDITLAALLHDFNYARKKPDLLNISHTLDRVLGLYHIDNKIKNLISETEFNPNIPLPKDVSDGGRYVRDADQLYSSYFFNDKISNGLMEEFGQTDKIKFIIRNINYVSDLPLYTTEAKELSTKILPSVIRSHTNKLQEELNL